MLKKMKHYVKNNAIKAVSLSVSWQISSIKYVKEQHKTVWTQKNYI